MCHTLRGLYRLLTARNLAAAKTHRQNSEVYGDVMSGSKVQKWVRMFKDGRVHNDVAPLQWRPHITAQTQGLISSFGWEQLHHPPYSPELALGDCYLFWYLKAILGNQRLNDVEEVETAVLDWASSQSAGFFHLGIQTPVDQCLNRNGNNIEK